MHNNEYDTSLIEKPLNQGKQRKDTHTDPQNQKIKWVTFTYYGKETRKITKLFRDTKLKVAYRTRNTILNILRTQPHINKFKRSRIYCMKCLDCPKKYIGQTGRAFSTRYMEHIYDIRSNNSNTGYAIIY
jgi:hypothetical protein